MYNVCDDREARSLAYQRPRLPFQLSNELIKVIASEQCQHDPIKLLTKSSDKITNKIVFQALNGCFLFLRGLLKPKVNKENGFLSRR